MSEQEQARLEFGTATQKLGEGKQAERQSGAGVTKQMECVCRNNKLTKEGGW
jgi:hypothetical protein